MLEAMIDMGRTLLRDSDLLSEKVKKLDSVTPKGEKRYVVKFNFCLEEKRLEMDIEEIGSQTAAKYVLLDREGGPNNPQWYITFEKCDSLISQSLPNFLKKLEEGILRKQISEILQTFFKDLGVDVDCKYRYVLDIQKCFGYSQSVEDMLKVEKKINEKNACKNVVLSIAAEIVKLCIKKFEIRKEQAGLFTILIDGIALAQHPLYKKIIGQSLAERMADGSVMGLVCSCCGSDEGCTSDLRDISIKYYTTNQCIFAHKLNHKNYDKNFVLCKTCYESLLAAEKFVKKELRSRIADFDTYIIPHVLHGRNINGPVLKKMVRAIDPVIDRSRNLEEIQQFKNTVANWLDKINKEDGYSYLLNFLFYRQLNQATKIQKMIKDVQPSVFALIDRSLSQARELFEPFFTEKTYLHLRRDLKMIYYMHPIKLQDGNPAQYQRILNVYESLFYRRFLQTDQIFRNIAEVLRIIWRQRAGYNVSFTDPQYFAIKVLEAMFYLVFLQKFGALERKGGDQMVDYSIVANDELRNYLDAMKYSETQTAVFLLGVLIGSIGREQSSRSEEGTYKPVLNKINFNGMDQTRMMKLSVDIFNKLRQEKILRFVENIHYAHMYWMSRNRDSWDLNKDEGLFYLLAGYSFQTLKKKKKKEEGESTDEDNERTDTVSI